MRRMCNFALVLIVMLGLVSCGQSIETQWQEQYDLGVRYLSEGNYEEAIIAFTADIEIDAKRPMAYMGLADAHERNGDLQAALAVLKSGYELIEDADLYERIAELEEQIAAENLSKELQPIVEELAIRFQVDEIQLGSTGIETAKATYRNRPYAQSNLMNDDTEDTVYVCFGYETPIPEGYKQDEFGFLFSGAVGDGPVHHIVIQDRDFLCFEALRIGDSGSQVLEFFGLSDVSNHLNGSITCETQTEKKLTFSGDQNDFYISYQDGTYRAQLDVVGGRLHSIIMDTN